MVICQVEVVKLSKLAVQVTGTVRKAFKFVILIRKILNFAIAFEDKYEETFIATSIVDILKGMIGSGFQTK